MILNQIYLSIPKKIQKKILFIKYYLGFDLNQFDPKNVFSCYNPDKTVIILGLPRGGTSLVGNILTNLDIDLGKHLISPSPDNKLGFFENRDIVRLNNHLLAKAGGTWDNPPSYEKLLHLGNNDSIKRKISRTMLRNHHLIWGWKDPRTVLTFSLFLPHIRNPYIIAISRNLRNVSKSLSKQQKISPTSAEALATEYSERLNHLLEIHSTVPILKISFEDLIRSEKKEVQKIKGFLGIKKSISSIVNKNMVHNKIK